MPIESLPERGALWLENWILSSTLAQASNALSSRPARRLLTPHRSDPWRTPNATANAFVVFDLGEPRLPECVALIGSNLDGGTAFRFRGSDDADQLANPVFWDLPLYKQDRVGQVMRWYLGDPTSGTAGPRRYWGVRILPATFGSYNTPDPWFEIGVVWLGEYIPIRPWQGIRIRAHDRSTRRRAYSGVQWSDPLTPRREAEVPLGGLTVQEVCVLDDAIGKQGPKHALLDLHAFSTDPIMKTGGCLYGTFGDPSLEAEFTTPENNAARLRFEEAAG